MKKILIYCLVYLLISGIFYLITIDFNKKDFMCENVRENSISHCNSFKYFLKETPLWALINLLFYPFILSMLVLFIINYRAHKKILNNIRL